VVPPGFRFDQFLLALETKLEKRGLALHLENAILAGSMAQLHWQPSARAKYRLATPRQITKESGIVASKRRADEEPEERQSKKGPSQKVSELIAPLKIVETRVEQVRAFSVVLCNSHSKPQTERLLKLCATDLFGLGDCRFTRLDDHQTLKLHVPTPMLIDWRAYSGCLDRIFAWWLEIEGRLPESVSYSGTEPAALVIQWKL
jgi:hypothetical protein